MHAHREALEPVYPGSISTQSGPDLYGNDPIHERSLQQSRLASILQATFIRSYEYEKGTTSKQYPARFYYHSQHGEAYLIGVDIHELI